MEKADIQKSLIIFNCFALSWSDVRVTQLVSGSVFQVKSPFSLNEGHGYTACWWTRACPCSMLPDVKHLENGLVFKREQLWRAISWLFQQSKRKPKRKKKTLENPEELKAGWTHPQLATVGWGSLALSWGSSMPLSLSKVTTCKIHDVVGLVLMDRWRCQALKGASPRRMASTHFCVWLTLKLWAVWVWELWLYYVLVLICICFILLFYMTMLRKK